MKWRGRRKFKNIRYNERILWKEVKSVKKERVCDAGIREG